MRTRVHFQLVYTSKMADDDAYCNPSIDMAVYKQLLKEWYNIGDGQINQNSELV